MYHPLLASLYFLIIESAVIFIANSNLIALHIWLYFHDMTTYEYICYRRKLQRSSKVISYDKVKSGNLSHNDTILANEEDQFKTPRTSNLRDKFDYSYLADHYTNLKQSQDYLNTDINSDGFSRFKTEKAPSLEEIIEENESLRGLKDQYILGHEWNCYSSSL